MNEPYSEQLQIDFVTGAPTALDGLITSAAERATCAALNFDRARSIMAAPLLTTKGESISLNVWDAAFTRNAKELRVPLISLSDLGFTREEEGLICPPSFFPLKIGAEAEPYFHRESGMVYKFFNLRATGALGKKISFEPDDRGEFVIRALDAVLTDTLEKLRVLHAMGAHPTEIVGLSDHGDYLIAKQPFATSQCYNQEERPYGEDYEAYLKDREHAIVSICGKICRGHGLRNPIVVSWLEGSAWLISDLHHRNIMRDASDAPTIIDALIAPVTIAALEKLGWLREIIADVKTWRQKGEQPTRKQWKENYPENEY